MSDSRTALNRDDLWRILVNTVHALPMYKSHKRYVEDVMIKERPDISSEELAIQLNIPLGEALVLLDEIRGKRTNEDKDSDRNALAANRTLPDFRGQLPLVKFI